MRISKPADEVLSRWHQTCDFSGHATSAPAELGGEIHNVSRSRARMQVPLQAEKWHVSGSGMFGAFWNLMSRSQRSEGAHPAVLALPASTGPGLGRGADGRGRRPAPLSPREPRCGLPERIVWEPEPYLTSSNLLYYVMICYSIL